VIEVDLRRFALFEGLDDDELDAVASLLEARELVPDEAVWREGEAADGLLLLDEGTLRFESLRDGGLGTREAPACLGAASLVAPGPRAASAFASGPGRALLLNRTTFERLVEGSPHAAARVLAALATELASVLRAGVPFAA
jgi:CRP-like cAMP-binding protein